MATDRAALAQLLIARDRDQAANVRHQFDLPDAMCVVVQFDGQGTPMSTSLKFMISLAFLALTAASAAVMINPGPAVAKPRINTIGSPGIAIKGYDPVAYFEQGGPRKGSAAQTYSHKGVTWRFSSPENLAKFKANPAKYTPAYGGYCAYGVAQGYLVKIEPNAWKIIGGKLYLNYDKSVQRQWEKKPGTFIKRANSKFGKLISK